MFSPKSILAPVDFSEASQFALDAAVDLAKRYSAKLTLIHVFDLPPAYAGMDIPPVDLVAPVVEAARKELDGKLAVVRTSIPDAQGIVAQGVPWKEIVDTVKRTRADLVVLGTHGRRGFKRAILGSVAERVVRHSTAPVLTFRPPGTPSEDDE